MFGSSTSSSPPKNEDAIEESSAPGSPKVSAPPSTSGIIVPETLADGAKDAPSSPGGRKSEESVPGDQKRSRRSSGIAKAKEMFGGARSYLNASPTRANASSSDSGASNQTPIQKLGRTDPALSVPQGSLNNAAGESSPGPRSTFRVGVTEDKNKKCRRTMEDTHAYLYNFLSTPAPSLELKPTISSQSAVSQSGDNKVTPVSSNQPVIETDNGYFAIFDGHAGTFAAEWCGKKLHLLLEDNIRKNPNKAIPELLDETFTAVDTQLEKLPLKNSGCTAVIAVLRWEDRIPNSQSATGSTSIAPAVGAGLKEGGESVETKIREAASRQRVLYTANVGDARIVLCRNGKALRLSYDHKGSDDNEGKRIANAGGLILNNRVNGVLAVTRALGDAYMKDLVTGHPYTTETVIQPDLDEFLILACDGLWDVCTDQEAVDLIRNTPDAQLASRMLVDHALARFSTDNLSCMVVRFDSQAVADAVASRVEPIGVDGDPASKVQGGVTEATAIVGASRRSMEGDGTDGAFRKGNELSKSQSPMILEQEEPEEVTAQEPGPELDPDGLAAARQKAAEGQREVKGLPPT